MSVWSSVLTFDTDTERYDARNGEGPAPFLNANNNGLPGEEYAAVRGGGLDLGFMGEHFGDVSRRFVRLSVWSESDTIGDGEVLLERRQVHMLRDALDAWLRRTA